MAQQRGLFDDEKDPEAMRRLAAQPARRRRSRWLSRTELLVRVVVRLYLGLLLAALPWTRFWTENGLFSYTRGTDWIAGNGFVRGVISGLGLLNVGLSLAELFAGERDD